MTRADYIAAYIEALNLSAIDGISGIWFAKRAHADLVADCCRDANTGEISRDGIINAAALVGASWQTTEQVRALADTEVERLLGEVKVLRETGGLKAVNADYKAYRQAQVAQRQRSISYETFLANFMRSLIRLAAENFHQL